MTCRTNRRSRAYGVVPRRSQMRRSASASLVVTWVLTVRRLRLSHLL